MTAYPISGKAIVHLRLTDISTNPAQPRTVFDEEAISSLAESIRRHGLLSPLLVRRVDAGRYELVAGERRFRALRLLGHERAEAVIVAAYDGESAMLALIENLQREQLHYLDEAEACRALLDGGGMTQEVLARELGRSPSALANRLRLLKLAPEVRAVLLETGLSERHARALLIAPEERREELARQAARCGWNVRQLEQRAACARKSERRPLRAVARDPRLYVNAVLDTLKRIKTLGANPETSVQETEDGTEIRILLRPSSP